MRLYSKQGFLPRAGIVVALMATFCLAPFLPEGIEPSRSTGEPVARRQFFEEIAGSLKGLPEDSRILLCNARGADYFYLTTLLYPKRLVVGEADAVINTSEDVISRARHVSVPPTPEDLDLRCSGNGGRCSR